MPFDAGFVQSAKLLADGAAIVSVGPTSDDATLLSLVLDAGDPAGVLAMKRLMLSLLTKACSHGFAVEVVSDSAAHITSVATADLETAPNDQPVHEDFFAVTGSDFPDDAQLVFDGDTATVVVTPDLVRPHLLLVTSLPTAVPLGWNTLTVTSSSGDTAPFPVDVSDEPPYVKRVLNAGAPKTYPFTLAIVANGAIDRDGTLDLYPDPILGDRTGYHDIVNYAMGNIFAVDEDFLRPDDRDAEMRIVSIFDEALPNDSGSCLCQEDSSVSTGGVPSTVMFAVRERTNAFLLGYQEVADLCIAFHGSPTHTRGSANRCADDDTRGTPLAFTYDGVGYLHHRFRDEPGTTAISVNNSTTRMTAIHELGHCASEDDNGRVRDLYQDNTYTELTINKKWRAVSTDPIPDDFAEYNGATYKSDQTRDSLGYPSSWVTYHCRLAEPTAPNLMDSYTTTSRFDRITYAWYRDRIRVSLNR